MSAFAYAYIQRMRGKADMRKIHESDISLTPTQERLLGYIAAAYLKMPVIGVALVGCVFALKHYNDVKENAVTQGASELAANDGEPAGREDWI